MKNTLKFLLTGLAAVGFASCESEDNFEYVAPPASFKITSPTSGSSVVLDPLYTTNPGVTLTWEAASYGSPTAVNYVIQVVKTGNTFETPIIATSTSKTFVTLSVSELNGAAISAGLLPFTQGGIDIRIKSSVGTQAEMAKYSDVITYLVKPYTTDLPKISVPGAHQAWDPATAPALAASAFGKTDFEGFLWLTGDYLFTGPNNSGVFVWDNKFGDDGSFSGVLLAGNSAVNCNVSTAGYYYVKANTGAVSATNTGGLKYSSAKTSWGIIGAATPQGWNNSTALTYNTTTKKWEGIVVMTAGEYKFRANDAWTINLGKDNNADNSMDFDGPNFAVAAGGTYKVELDLSKPRKYTSTLTLQ
jgi:starch-binding outer membrane protein SusE/F